MMLKPALTSLAANCYSKRWANWNWLGSWTRGWMAGWSWLWCCCGIACAQVPPAPPSFTSPASTVLQSPKGAEQRLTLGPVRIAFASTTNHAAPTASIEFYLVPTGQGETDATVTNDVPFKAWTELGAMRFEFLGETNKTYELQTHRWMTEQWWCCQRFILPRSDTMTMWYGIDLGERQRFFRVRSN